MHGETRVSCWVIALLASSAVLAQTATPPSGHWEGTLRIPGQELKVAIDLRATGGDLKDGDLTGTWTQGPRSWPLVFKRK